jgi:hypothetical protein
LLYHQYVDQILDAFEHAINRLWIDNADSGVASPISSKLIRSSLATICPFEKRSARHAPLKKFQNAPSFSRAPDFTYENMARAKTMAPPPAGPGCRTLQ